MSAEKCFKILEEFSEKKFAVEDEMWEFYVKRLSEAFGCEAATYFEADDDKKILSIKSATGPVSGDIQNVSFKYEGIAGWCAENKEEVFLDDAKGDGRFSAKMDFASGFTTKSVMAYPCVAGSKIIGVGEFINPAGEEFTRENFTAGKLITRLVSQSAYILRLEETIKKINLKGESTINNLSGGFIGSDMNGKIIFFNPKAKEIFAVGDEYVGKSIFDLASLCPEFVTRLGEVLKLGRTVRRQEVKCEVKGKTKIVGYSSINIKGVDGKNIGAGVIFQDITNL